MEAVWMQGVLGPVDVGWGLGTVGRQWDELEF